MPQVFPGREVAHVWNSQTQEEGRNNNGQFYFTGKRRIYSYGSHFLAGFIMPDGVALLNSSGYSNTTSKHKSFASYATCNRRQIYAPNLTELDYPLRAAAEGEAKRWRSAARAYLLKYASELGEEAGEYLAGVFGLLRSWPAIKRQAERDAAKAKRERERQNHAAALEDAKRLAGMTAEAFALAIPDGSGRDVVSGNYTESRASFTKRLSRAHKAASSAGQTRRKRILWERLKAIRDFERDPEAPVITASAEAIKAERERRQREAFEREERRRNEWLSGVGHGRFSDPSGGALLRIVGDPAKPDEAELETSHGARVPLSHAVKVFRFVKLIRETAGHWQRNGRTVRVGHYQLDSIDPDGFNAGCHRINWPEIERVAKLAGVFELAPSDQAAELSRPAA